MLQRSIISANLTAEGLVPARSMTHGVTTLGGMIIGTTGTTTGTMTMPGRAGTG